MNYETETAHFVVAYDAERTIADVLTRIPARLADELDVEVLVIDDASGDNTFEQGERCAARKNLPFPLQILYNPDNQGYGGNQKIGFHFALENGFDYVALLHGDGSTRPRRCPSSSLRSSPARPTWCSARECSNRAARCGAGCRSTSSSATRS